MSRRGRTLVWLGAGSAVLIAVALGALPVVVRRVAVSKISAATGRHVAIGSIDVNVFTGRVAVNAFRLADRGGAEPFVQFEQLEARIYLLPLLAGHLRVGNASVRAPMIRIVRTGPKEFNFSDLLAPSTTEAPPKRGGIDVTLQDFTLVGGAVSVEDRAIAPSHTWKVQDLTFQVRDLSTRATGAGGSASVTFSLAGTPISIQGDSLRLAPANARVTMTIQGFDLALLRAYPPPDAPVSLQRGRLSTSLTLEYGAEKGTRIGGNVNLNNVVLVRSGQTSPFVSLPALTVAINDLAVTNTGMTTGRIELAGNPSVFDTSVSPPARFDLKAVRAAVEGVTWPARQPARVKVSAALPSSGGLDVRGVVHLAPLRADLRLALNGVDLAPYQRYLPISAPLAGKADADLSLTGSIDGTVKANVRGKAALSLLIIGPRDHPVLTV